MQDLVGTANFAEYAMCPGEPRDTQSACTAGSRASFSRPGAVSPLASVMSSGAIDVKDVKVKDAAGEKAALNAPMVTLLELFRFYGPEERAMLAVGVLFCMIGGVAFPCINIAFGELLDSTASMSNIEETTKNAVMFMIGVALVLGVSLAAGFGLVGWAAARGASNVRREYLKSMMAQDVAFFDAAKAGELSAATSEKVQILQNGTAKKMGELVQSTFTGVGGLAVGFYFSWELSLVIMAGVPMLAGALYFLVKATTKLTAANPEYEKAGAIATESLTACRVTSALNAQGRVAERYESHLGDAERVATKNLWNISFANGGLFGVMFIMYAAGLWFGAYLISDSTNGAMSKYPPPAGLLDPFDASWGQHANISAMLCYEAKTGDAYVGDALLACACALDYSIMETETKLVNPNCGCGYRSGDLSSTGLSAGSSPCMTGGTVIMVFFAVLIGGFSFGMAGSSIEAVIKARTAARQLYEVIDRKPKGGDGADARTPTGLALKTPVSGDIMFNAVHFSYTTRPVFRGIDLHIPAGMTVALVGESGCGKSTVTRLLERFYDPSAGTITLDGVDITKLRIDELRSAIGVVSQEPLLFNASIRMNIAVGRAGLNTRRTFQLPRSSPPRAQPPRTTSSPPSRTATIPSLAARTANSPGVRSSASPSRERLCAIRPSSSWMRQPRRSTPRTSAWSRLRSTTSSPVPTAEERL